VNLHLLTKLLYQSKSTVSRRKVGKGKIIQVLACVSLQY